MFGISLLQYLATGVVAAMDASPSTDIQRHDARYHGGHYDGTSSCKFRKAKASGDNADDLAKTEKAEAVASAPGKQDYDDLMEIRDRLEPIARLLNGRTGNIQALQASSRWHKLINYPTKHVADFAKLAHLANDISDPAFHKAALALADVATNIQKSSVHNWNTPAGMVPSRSDLPTFSGSKVAAAPAAPASAATGGGLSPAAVLAAMGGATKLSPSPSASTSAASGGLGGSYSPFRTKSVWATAVDSVNANHPAINNANYFKDCADKLTPNQAIADMEARGDIVKGGYRDAFDKNDPDDIDLWSGWHPSAKLSDDTVRCVAVCFEDLRKRFPNMPWKSNLEVRCGTKPFTGGQSTHTSDWRRHTVLFNCDYGDIWPSTGLGKSNYGHPDARFPFDVLRHEMGHALISGVLPNGKRMITKWHKAMTKAYGNPARDLEKFAGRYVSQYAVTNKGHGFSMAECLSECFSLATSPDYKPGYLPPPVEDFIYGEMLGMKKPTA